MKTIDIPRQQYLKTDGDLGRWKLQFLVTKEATDPLAVTRKLWSVKAHSH